MLEPVRVPPNARVMMPLENLAGITVDKLTDYEHYEALARLLNDPDAALEAGWRDG